jgi:photosystem II stability/assembly factor-like uncharacterized protein
MDNSLALLAVSLCLASSAQALTVDEIVGRYIEARGGMEKIRALRSIRITGKAELGRDSIITANFGQVIQRPGMIRIELTLQGLTSVQAFDGREGWAVNPFQGRRDPQRISADESKGRAQDADIEGPLVGWREKGHRLEYLGTEDIDGTAAVKLRISLKDGDTLYSFLDPEHFLEIRRTTVRRIRGSEEISESDFRSYGQVAGLWIPFAIDTGSKGAPRSGHFNIETAEPNVEGDPGLFKFPADKASVVRAISPGPAAAPIVAKPAPRPSGKPAAPVIDSGVISGLDARNIGSAVMSGRVSALVGQDQGGKTTLYVGAASGGVWKSEDGGTTFKPVFDKQPVQSIGAIAVDPSNPKTVWVGTGESWTRNSVSIGDGIYKSTDGGETWAQMGLPQSERIDRIIVHPTNGSVVYACVPGKLWSDSRDRGLYKTVDGGKSWSLVLAGRNLSTGCTGLALDAKNPEILFAGMWDFRRAGWTFRSGGNGPSASSGSGLFRSADGGKSWTELTSESHKGIPAKPWGRIEVAIAPSDPTVVYALIESKDSALYRSADGGNSWEERDKSNSMVWRPFYFARLIVDPKNADRVFKPNLQLVVSEDGGRSFSNAGGGLGNSRGHGDWHDLWIDPTNTNHIVGGDDGGLWISWDRGNRWWKADNLPVSQFYHVSVDEKDPYQVYGGLQDNSTWVGDSAYGTGITNARWENLFGGDGFWAVPDPTDSQAVYVEAQGGHIGRIDRRTNTARPIQPKAGYHEKLRFNWNSPIVASPSDKQTLYLGAQFLFRSRDKGDNWERISPDLTTNDPEKQKQEESGGVTVDNSDAERHTTIYSISESALDAKVIWVGTDDGNLQLTRDGGKSWTNLVSNVKGLPKSSWVSWVQASRFAPGTAYAAFDRHTFGEMTPWVYRTTDFGKSWTPIVGPEQGVRGYVHVIKEDLVAPSLLFVGTELGLWISLDSGRRWAEFKGGDFPSVAVRDIQIHPRDHDLVLATHGRGIWIIDDITPLRSLSNELLSREAVFLASRPVQQRMRSMWGWAEGDAHFIGPNPPGGAVISYYQRSRHLFGPIKLEVVGEDGKLVDTIPPSNRRGVNRVVWSMQVKPPRVPRAATVAFGASHGPRVLPGMYTVRLTKGSEVVETKLPIGLDRRAPYDVADRKQQFDAAMRVHALFGEMSGLVDQIEAARAGALARLKAVPQNDELGKRVAGVANQLEEIRKKIVATKEGGAITGEERLREHTEDLYSALVSWEGRPAKYLLERTDVLKRELEDVKSEFNSLVTEKLRPLNAQLEERKLQPIPTTTTAGSAAGSP